MPPQDRLWAVHWRASTASPCGPGRHLIPSYMGEPLWTSVQDPYGMQISGPLCSGPLQTPGIARAGD